MGRITLPRFTTGLSVPVFSLRGTMGCGTGEFADLADLGTWCAAAGIGLVQVLPVNDTGWNSSPYSALSAFALHPLYLRLTDVPGAEPFASEIRAFAEHAAGPRRLAYRETLEFKLSVAERIFRAGAGTIRRDRDFANWRSANPWVVPYAVFSALKKERGPVPWSSWPAPLRDPSPSDIGEWRAGHEEQCLLHEWTQYLLEGQLLDASRKLRRAGILLKGDVPILMSEESVDVWASRGYFDLSARAGAPPDMYAAHGQNWGFPVYDWDRLMADGCGWWKDRLAQAAKFFHAFRIDHVLGFFRIWSIPHGETSGLLGRFSPAVAIPRTDLSARGFDDGRIRWLSVPHITAGALSSALGEAAPHAAGLYLDRMNGEQMYNLKPEVDGEAAIHGLDETPAVKQFLLAAHADRALLPAGGGAFLPSWYWEASTAFRSLAEAEKSTLRELAAASRAQSEEVWEKRGRVLLATLRDATDMLVCAEDLGDVPACVPRVLADLSILGLRIQRWSREYGAPGAPFIPPARYPLLSVCTPSVHDTSTLRAWWEEDSAERDRFFASLGQAGACPDRLGRDLLQRILEGCADSGSLLCVFQLQELLDLDEGLWSADPRDDRINVPGTVSDTNWTWRMPVDLEELCARGRLTAAVRSLAERRGRV
jgi:4-alpha-glucanotransferase